MDERSIRAVDVLLDQVRLERTQQLQHFDALDSKAGILLGFAGALIALAPTGYDLVLDAGRATALVAASFALWTFWPRFIPMADLYEMRQDFRASDEASTKLTLLDTQIEMIRTSRTVLRNKARRLKRAMASLGLASVLTAVGVSVR